MHRLFVAIRPPQAIIDLIMDRMGGVSGARWQNEDQIHLTVRFIGEVDRHLAADVAAALATVHLPAFDLALNGLGTFDRRGQVETLWAGVTPHEPLKTLHKKVDQALARVGVPPDQRAYMPHITLARLKRHSGPVRDVLEAQGGLISPSFRVRAFGLYESQLTPEGAVYTLIEEHPLR